jgi:ATP-dependent Clp protease ATP-binding subunit ClpA
VCVLQRSDFARITWNAYFVAGADRLVRRENQGEIARLPESIHGLARHIRLWTAHSNSARRVIFAAEAEAARLGAAAVGPEHLLLGLVAASLEKPTIAGEILAEQLGIPLESLRDATLELLTPGTGTLGPDVPMTPQARRVLDLAVEEVHLLQNTGIGTEHQLLGLIREGENLASRVLVELGADLERTRRETRMKQAKLVAAGLI